MSLIELPTPRLRKLAQDRMFEVALSKRGLGPVAGVDEAGRGACAGPMVVAACMLPDRVIPELRGLTDSKKLTPAARERLYPVIKKVAIDWSVVSISAQDIDRIGVGTANLTGMRRAVEKLGTAPGYVLTDAWRIEGLRAPHLPVIGGDAAARCIAAASVLAKVARDHIMVAIDAEYPGYGFAAHKGYGTASHMESMVRLGPSLEHRFSYANVAKAEREHLQQYGPDMEEAR